MKIKELKDKNYSVIRKLRNDRKLNEEMEIFVSNITLEDLIALKLEIASKSTNGKLFGIPIWKSMPQITRDALLKCAVSVCRTNKDAANFLGISAEYFTIILNKYNTAGFFEDDEEND
tara:strand:- start:220 stop:573 length:354 start_codon:yes stop_codon:yes gene_type:complete